MKTKENKELTDFEWEDSNEFFNTDNIPLEKEVKKEEEEEDESIKEVENLSEKEEKTTVKKVETKEESKEEFFEKESKEELEDESKEKETVKVSYKSTLKTLKDSDIFSIDIDFEENSEIEEEDFLGYIEEEVEARVNAEIERFGEGLTEEDKKFIKFRKEGGKLSDYFQSLQTTSLLEDYQDEDFTKEEVQEQFLVEYYMTFEGFDREEAEDKVDWLKERDKLESTVTTKKTKAEEKDKIEKDNLLKKVQEQKVANQKNAREYREDLKKTLKDIENVGSIKIPKKEKEVLFDYLMKPNVKTTDGRLITGFQQDLAEVYKDKKMLVAFAKVIKDKFEIENLEAGTKLTQKIKKNLRTGSTANSKSLTDYF